MENLDASVIQQNLFRYILAQAGPKAAVSAICEALHINKSSAYNRLNGSKRIDLDELAQNWMANLRKKCVRISREAEGARRQYFEHIRAGIRASQQETAPNRSHYVR